MNSRYPRIFSVYFSSYTNDMLMNWPASSKIVSLVCSTVEYIDRYSSSVLYLPDHHQYLYYLVSFSILLLCKWFPWIGGKVNVLLLVYDKNSNFPTICQFVCTDPSLCWGTELRRRGCCLLHLLDIEEYKKEPPTVL